MRALKKVSDRKNLVVRIRGGIYLLPETLVFSLEDSAPDGGTITYAAYLHETPILSSGMPIRSWRKLREAPPGLPDAARGKVWVADLPPGIDRFFTLYDGLQRLPRARSEGFTPPEFVKPNQPLDQFRFPAGTLKNWPDLKEAELLVIPSCDYEMNILPIAAVDERASLAKTALAPSRPIGRVKYFDKTLWVENILEALNEPGEWVFSAATQDLSLAQGGPSERSHRRTQADRIGESRGEDRLRRPPRPTCAGHRLPRALVRSHRPISLARLHRLEFAAQLGNVRSSHGGRAFSGSFRM